MKKISILLAIFSITLFACDDYLDVDPENKTPSGDALDSVDDIKAALNGVYYWMGSYYFCGNYVLALGDFASDISVADESSGHFVRINKYQFDENDAELADIWEVGYKVVSSTTRMIKPIEDLLKKESVTDADKESLHAMRAQALALRAMAYFHLVNVYGLPYGTDNNKTGGVVLMLNDKLIMPYENVSRSSVEDTYTEILKGIATAETEFASAGSAAKLTPYYLNPAALQSLKARVMLFKKDYTGAIAAAEEALRLHGVTEVSEDKYLAMWKELAPGDEEIFTIVKSEDDNLSSNSLNTLYGSYKGALALNFTSIFSDKDYRTKLISGNHPMKFDGIAASKATSNIPMFRVSEMHLILAEAYAHSNIAKSKEHLLFTAQRDGNITGVDDLPSEMGTILPFIALERKREFFQEGHRYYDARRTGELIKVSNGGSNDFDIQKFVMPIPSKEINSGYKCEQNDKWYETLPTFPEN